MTTRHGSFLGRGAGAAYLSTDGTAEVSVVLSEDVRLTQFPDSIKTPKQIFKNSSPNLMALWATWKCHSHCF